MEETVFDEGVFLDSGNLFSESVSNNKWVLYHGTTSIIEEEILAGGLRRHPVGKDLIEKFVRIYESTGMQNLGPQSFPGLRSGNDGYVNLKSWTLGVDFEEGFNKKPIYFTELLTYALGYTGSIWAGGETVASLRESLENLRRYCAGEKYRNLAISRYWKDLQRIHGYLLPQDLRSINSEMVSEREYAQAHDIVTDVLGEISQPRSLITTVELQERLDEFSSELGEYIEPDDDYQYGIILAVQFDESDLDSFRIRHSGLNQGFGYDGEISIGKIVGLCRILGGHKRTLSLMEKMAEVMSRRREDPEDIVFHLVSMPETGSPSSSNKVV